MSAYGDDPRYHAIVDERFVCTAPGDAPCRTVPTCDCENWCCCDGSPEDAADNHDDEALHCCMTTTRADQPCWIEPWVNASGLEDSYDGDPLKVWTDDDEGESHWPSGPVTCDWDGDYVAWSYARSVPDEETSRVTDAYDELRKDWCDAGDMPRATCHHCGAHPGGPSLPPPERPWTFDGQKMTRRSGRNIFPEPTVAPAPRHRLLSEEKLPKATCRYDDVLGWVTREHVRECKAIDCRGCKPCGDDHCGLRGCAQHVNHAADLWTCPRCIGQTRADLTVIEQLYALVDTDVELRTGQADYLGLLLDQAAENGAESEAFNLIGPAADPAQYGEKRNRLRAAYARRGWCDWPRHEGFHDDDPHHPYAVLGRWDLELRPRYGPHTDLFVTVVSAADYLRTLLDGRFPHQDLFEQFAADIRACREHLEQITHNSRTPEQGRHCPRCVEARGRGPRLQKRYAAHAGLPAGILCAAKDGSQGRILKCEICDGQADTWHCPDDTGHWWTDHDYRERVATDYVEHATELPAAELAERLDLSLSTVRKWAARTWDKQAKAYREPLLVSRRRGADGRKLYPVARALELAERRGA